MSPSLNLEMERNLGVRRCVPALNVGLPSVHQWECEPKAWESDGTPEAKGLACPNILAGSTWMELCAESCAKLLMHCL